MAKLLYTQREVLDKLHVNGIATFKKAAFSEAVKIGRIPFHKEAGVKQKLYDYDEVVEAIYSSGIGKPPSDFEKLDKVDPPQHGQSQVEYGEHVVKELGKKPTLTDANIYKTLYAGKLERLKYEEKAGELIPRSEVEDKAFAVARAIRDKLLTVPERLSNELATIDDAHAIKELLFKEFNILLEGFSHESFE